MTEVRTDAPRWAPPSTPVAGRVYDASGYATPYRPTDEEKASVEYWAGNPYGPAFTTLPYTLHWAWQHQIDPQSGAGVEFYNRNPADAAWFSSFPTAGAMREWWEAEKAQREYMAAQRAQCGICGSGGHSTAEHWTPNYPDVTPKFADVTQRLQWRR